MESVISADELLVTLVTPTGATIVDVFATTVGELIEQARQSTLDPVSLVVVSGDLLVLVDSSWSTKLRELSPFHDGCSVQVHSSKTISNSTQQLLVRMTQWTVGRTAISPNQSHSESLRLSHSASSSPKCDALIRQFGDGI
jgi:hypothetical protein